MGSATERLRHRSLSATLGDIDCYCVIGVDHDAEDVRPVVDRTTTRVEARATRVDLRTEIAAELSRRLREDRVAREVERRLTLIDEWGEDDLRDGDALWFQRTWPTSSNVTVWYTYVALKARGLWYITGGEQLRDLVGRQSGPIHRRDVGWTWDRMVEWLCAEGEPVPRTDVYTLDRPVDPALRA